MLCEHLLESQFHHLGSSPDGEVFPVGP